MTSITQQADVRLIDIERVELLPGPQGTLFGSSAQAGTLHYVTNKPSPEALGGEMDTWDPRAEGVSLLTLHASKGLELPVVFLVGCEDGLLPLRQPGGDTDLAEERRLFFVGITRARSRLFLFHSRRRTLRGQTVEARPSPFLADLEERLLERRQGVARPRRPEQMKLI